MEYFISEVESITVACKFIGPIKHTTMNSID